MRRPTALHLIYSMFFLVGCSTDCDGVLDGVAQVTEGVAPKEETETAKVEGLTATHTREYG